jgi:hypothetical protein
MNQRGFERIYSWPDFKVLSWELSAGTEGHHEEPQEE